ncbi:hypothetical protein Tco_1235689 [Tanacetum coccineum]
MKSTHGCLVPSLRQHEIQTRRANKCCKETRKTDPKRSQKNGSSIKKDFHCAIKNKAPRSCLRWKPTGKIFKTVGLKWIPTGKIFTSSTTKVDCEPQNGSNDDITNQYECKQTLDVSAGTLNIHAGTSLNPTKEGLRVWPRSPRQMTYDHNSSELGIHDHSNELSSSKLVPKVVPPADKTATSRQESLARYQVYQGRLLASFQDDAKYEHVGQDTRSQGGKDDQDGRIKILKSPVRNRTKSKDNDKG